MLHVRLIAPPESTPQVLQFLEASTAVTHLCVNEQSARKPSGDVVSFDVAREGATSVLEALRGFGLEHKGAIVVENLDISISESAIRAEEETPGEPADAVVWEELEQSAGEETRLSITYLCFMIVATMIAGIGVMLDQPILIVGAMVVGPEFGPLVALCIGIVTRRRQPATRALGTLVLGFAVGMAAAVILTWILTAVGLLNESMLIAERPLDELHLEARCALLDCWFPRGHRRHARAYLRQVRRSGGCSHLSDDDPGRRQRGRGARLLGTERGHRLRDPAGDQLVRHRRCRNAHLARAQDTGRATRTAGAQHPTAQ